MNWKDFLKKVSKTLIDNNDLLEEFQTDKSNDWLGYPPITDIDILKHENRLKTILPPSYKAFLKETNGYKQLSSFIWNILPLDKVEWLKDFDSDFYTLYHNFKDDFIPSEEDYFTYGKEQNTTNFRADYLTETLAISGWGDSAIILLNPKVKFGDEWEAWMFANWYPGATRYKSFEELMKGEYSDYLNLHEE